MTGEPAGGGEPRGGNAPFLRRLLDQARRRWTSLRLAGRIALIASVLVLTFVVLPTELYVGRSDAFCSSLCHASSMTAATGQPEAHLALGCRDCHEATRWSSLRTVLLDAKSQHAPPSSRRCESCHEEQGHWAKARLSAGHREHLSRGVDCHRCHSSEGHQVAPTSKRCQSCHPGRAFHEDKMVSVPCASCHNFLGEESASVLPSRRECVGCHGGDQRKSPTADEAGKVIPARAVGIDDVHGTVDCKLCHHPHDDVPSKRRGGTVCIDCHKIDIAAQLEHGPDGHKQCAGCHKPHAPKAAFEGICLGCHQGVRSAALGTTTADKHEACSTCHRPHTWVVPRNLCSDCHTERANYMAARDLPGHAACQGCHVPHEAMPNADRCVRCHEDRKSHLTGAPRTHRNCMSCHTPHDDRSTARDACSRCHPEPSKTVASGPTGHRGGCWTCHQPHGSPIPPQAVCSKCHSEKASALSAAPSAHQQCSSCHAPHKFSIGSVEGACGRCHSREAAGQGPHRGNCRSCHQPHGAPIVQQGACQRCHPQVKLTTAAGPHQKCSSCHAPHVQASLASARCENCHPGQAKVAAMWKPGSAHAGPCQSCHTRHAVTNKKPCQTCHAEQAKSFADGKHAACTACHAPHVAPGNWWGRCSNCHAAQLAGAQKRGAVHRDCSKCHLPHKFARPSCKACHNALAGLHAISEHDSCSSCHETHAGGLPNRAACLSCHKERAAHNPEAKACTSCHLFK